MKKLIAFILIISCLSSLAIAVNAADCNHVWIGEKKSADCENLERTEYTCSICGEKYTANTIDIDDPSSFAIVLRSQRVDDKLTVTGTLYNNPSLLAGRISIYFDQSVVRLDSFENGTVWDDDDYTAGVTPYQDHITLYTETQTVNSHNSNNGLYFTLNFTVVSDGSYNITTRINSKDYNDWSNGKIVYYQPKVVNLVGKNEYGDHCYGDWALISEPDFDTPGIEECTCAVCGDIKTRETAPLEHRKKGDINDDSKVNAVDANLMFEVIVKGTNDIFVRDAADMNGDGHVNAVDANMICHAIVGG